MLDGSDYLSCHNTCVIMDIIVDGNMVNVFKHTVVLYGKDNTRSKGISTLTRGIVLKSILECEWCDKNARHTICCNKCSEELLRVNPTLLHLSLPIPTDVGYNHRFKDDTR